MICSVVSMWLSACCLAALLSRERTILASEGRLVLTIGPPVPPAAAPLLSSTAGSHIPAAPKQQNIV